MNRKTILIILLLCHVYVSAQFVPKNEAIEIIMPYLNNGNRDSDAKISLEEFSFFGTATLYCIKTGSRTVFMASDRRLPPIIAEIDGVVNNIYALPKPFIEYLQTYESALQDILQDRFTNAEENEKWHDLDSLRLIKGNTVLENIIVSPLLVKNGTEVHWGQLFNNDIDFPDSSKVYNLFCPPAIDGPSGHALVGCVAVAMGQLMWYWEWPASIASSKLSYIPNYDWSSMPTNIYNNTSQYTINQIAGLLSDCGKTVNMNYSANESYAYMSDCRNALINEFAYSPDITSIPYSASNELLIISELCACHPIIASGSKQGDSKGHAFVVDGYKVAGSDNLIHINWGWRGSYNGGFSSGTGTGTPTYLCPSSWVRIGDIVVKENNGDTVAYYNYNENFIINIVPQYPSCNDITINNISLPDNFSKYNGGKIFISNQTVQANKKGYFLSEREVRLLPGTHIVQGSKVLIGIRDMNCSSAAPIDSVMQDDNEEVPLQKQSARLSVNEEYPEILCNQFNGLLEISSENPLASLHIYNLNGQCLLKNDYAHSDTSAPASTTIDVSYLPSGVYVIYATTTGTHLQTKFIKE